MYCLYTIIQYGFGDMMPDLCPSHNWSQFHFHFISIIFFLLQSEATSDLTYTFFLKAVKFTNENNSVVNSKINWKEKIICLQKVETRSRHCETILSLSVYGESPIKFSNRDLELFTTQMIVSIDRIQLDIGAPQSRAKAPIAIWWPTAGRD